MILSKTEKTIGILLASLLLLLTLGGTWYFLSELGVTPLQWAMFNACSPSGLVYLLCFLLFLRQKKAIWLPVAILPMYYLAPWACLPSLGAEPIFLLSCRTLQ